MDRTHGAVLVAMLVTLSDINMQKPIDGGYWIRLAEQGDHHG